MGFPVKELWRLKILAIVRRYSRQNDNEEQDETEEKEENNIWTKTLTTETVSVKDEVEIEEIVDLEPAGTEEFDYATTAANEMLENREQEYCSIYTKPFQKKASMHSDARREYLT